MLAERAESGLVESKYNYAKKLCGILESESQIHALTQIFTSFRLHS